MREHALLRRLARRLGGTHAASSEPSSLTPEGIAQRPVASSPEADAIRERIQGIDWYHVIDLPHGVCTPGSADHRREIAQYGLPADMRGMRALDVATYDGFWAFEMERRGAEVTAVDIASWGELDLPLRFREGMKPEQDVATGAGFRVAAELLGSNVSRRVTSVYNLSPDDIGRFDVVFMSDLLQHLRDPQRALERVYSVTKPGGLFILAEEYSPKLDQFAGQALMQFRSYERYTWWVPSTAALRLMLNVAGFDDLREMARVGLNYDRAYTSQKVILHARR